MTKYFIRSMMFLILFLPQPTHSALCDIDVGSCPRSEDEITERRRKYNCTSGFFYTCLPDADYDYHERCSPAFYILNGTGGCPYIVKCHNRLGFIYGNTVSFKPCPENKAGCPPVYHSSYKIQDLYKYPACFYKDGDIPLVNVKMALKDHNQQLTQITTETTSAVASEHQIISQYPQTAFILLAVFLSLSIVTNMFFVTCYTLRRRKRKKSRKKEEPIVATVTYLEERVPLSSQDPSVMEFKDDVCKPITHANLIPSTNNTGSSDSGVDVRVRANLSLDKDFSDTSQVSKFNCKKMVNDVEEECTEKLLSETNLNIKRTSVDHQEHVIYIPNSRTEDLRIENVQRQQQS